jgi:hypothetical protein
VTRWRALLALVALAFALAAPAMARAQASKKPPPPGREAAFVWDPDKRFLSVSVVFRDALDEALRTKLTRGLPTTIVFTAALYRVGADKPVATTVQSCRITWLVWDEVYKIEITRPDGSETLKTVAVNGVLRRCAETKELLVGTRDQVPFGVPLVLQAKVQVNPVSPEVLQRLKRWVSRPTGTSTAAPGDALFSTFTGLFLQRIGEAERQLSFSTRPSTPKVKPKPKKKEQKG